jgi:hypothetical protein
MFKGLVVVLVVVLAAVFLLWRHGQTQWAVLTQTLTARLDAAREPLPAARFDRAELAGLPPVVQRWFETVLTDGAPIVSAASMQHTGTFNMSEDAEKWLPFTSNQRVVTRRPGFVWDGRIRMAPGVDVHVHDAYVAGEGILHPAILGVFSLTDLRGDGEIAEGELMRFLAEAAWYPTALLPSQGAEWAPVDDASARVTLRDGKIAVSMIFGFGTDGLVSFVRAEARGRTVNGRIVPTPWEGRWTGYEVREGMRVPMSGEVAWVLPEGRKPYWRGTVTRLEYEFATAQ